MDLASGEQLPDTVPDALDDSAAIKQVYNTPSEHVYLSAYLGRRPDPAGWRCSTMWAATLGLLLSPKGVGKVLNLDTQEMDEGKDLIKHFCVPDDNSQRWLPSSDPADWKPFQSYNVYDVQVETAIRQKLANFPVPECVREQYEVDQRINDRGICIDTTLAASATTTDKKHRA